MLKMQVKTFWVVKNLIPKLHIFDREFIQHRNVEKKWHCGTRIWTSKCLYVYSRLPTSTV